MSNFDGALDDGGSCEGYGGCRGLLCAIDDGRSRGGYSGGRGTGYANPSAGGWVCKSLSNLGFLVPYSDTRVNPKDAFRPMARRYRTQIDISPSDYSKGDQSLEDCRDAARLMLARYDAPEDDAPPDDLPCDKNCAKGCNNSRIFISNLPPDMTTDELEYIFGEYGEMNRIPRKCSHHEHWPCDIEVYKDENRKSDAAISFYYPRTAHCVARRHASCTIRGLQVNITMAEKSPPRAAAPAAQGRYGFVNANFVRKMECEICGPTDPITWAELSDVSELDLCDENCGDVGDRCNNSRIRISNLPLDVTICDMMDFFDAIGFMGRRRMMAKCVYNRYWPWRINICGDEHGYSKCEAVLSYEDPAAAHFSCLYYKDCKIRGSKLNVTMAEMPPPIVSTVQVGYGFQAWTSSKTKMTWMDSAITTQDRSITIRREKDGSMYVKKNGSLY